MNLRELGLAGIVAASSVFGGCQSLSLSKSEAMKDYENYQDNREIVVAFYGDYDDDGIVSKEETERLMGDIAKQNELVYVSASNTFYDHGLKVSDKKMAELFDKYFRLEM